MRYSFALPLAVTALATLASADVFDGTDMEETVQAQQNTFSGNYSVINVESGEYLAFVADDTGKVGIVTTAEESFVSLNVGSDGDLTGTVISTELGKCASAQWQVQLASKDTAFAPYCCRLGTYKTCDTEISLDKQLWSFVAVPDLGGSVDTETVELAASITDNTVELAVDFSASDKSSSSSSSTTTSSASSSTETSCDYKVKCCHQGPWLCRHPQYLDGHPQCQSRYNSHCSSSRLLKRSHDHKERSAGLVKRATTKATAYNLVVLNHIEDMVTQAVVGDFFLAFDDTKALKLATLDASDPGQQWILAKQS